MIPTLALAHELRARMLAAGARGLVVAAAYRPTGGAGDSQHKHFAALDLDLLDDADIDLSHVYARTAAQLWREHEHLRAGLGTYARDGALWTYRVHLDTGYRFRCWQGLPLGRGWARRPAALTLAQVDAGEAPALIAGRERAADDDCARQGATWPTR